MEIKGRKVLVLGGYGLVGMAVCRQLMVEEPEALIITSLLQAEAEDAVRRLNLEFPGHSVKLIPLWGNIFVRDSLKNTPRAHMLASAEIRHIIFADVLNELKEETLHHSYLYQIINGMAPEGGGVIPDAIVDCVNTATALAYQDIYNSAAEVLDIYERAEELWKMGSQSSQETSPYVSAVERLLASLYVPQLVRHIQILHEAMRRAKTKAYVKVGTSGTGGLGLNIPYTHGEEKPSRVLLSKSAMAGAHSLLLFLMGRTPDGPVIKEIKPSASITWKKIGYGPVRKRGKEIRLYDCPPENGLALVPGEPFNLAAHKGARLEDGVLQSVYIDTGENGQFSRAEYTAITSLGQMEAVTPEDIAFNIIREIKGINTGHDIVAALDGAVMGPSYRAGVLRYRAIARARCLEEQYGVESVAFEILGPPKLSKLLYEAYYLKRCFGAPGKIAATPPAELTMRVEELLRRDAELRRRAISIGIPILMPDGRTLLCAHREQGEHRWERLGWTVSAEEIERWAESEWIDLRQKNMMRWQERMRRLLAEYRDTPAPDFDSSSRWGRQMTEPGTWQLSDEMDIGEIVGWIFNEEERGMRMKG
jgi:hypothetical protein